jgi:hypothetical protein
VEGFDSSNQTHPREKWSTRGCAVDDLFSGNEKKCNQRRKLAALRDGIEGVGVTLYPSGETGSEVWSKGQVLYASGDLPGSPREAMERINHSLSENGQPTLKMDDVYIHYMEAGNNNYIAKYGMFLDATTLRNVADRGERGMAFMNSHRTGGLSMPADHPFGYTFSGRYEELEHDGAIHRRALLGVYMLKGHYPNGRTQPSTDDIHRAVDARTLRDVSLGINGGQSICDVCARSLGDKDCPHVPGSVKGMSPEQMQAQEARGVPGGKASYTVVDGQPYEVSAVFKGAVPGAGFRKAMAQKQTAKADLKFSREVVLAYGSMMDDGDLKFFEKGKPKMKLSDLAKLLGIAQSAGIELEDLDSGTIQSGTMVPVEVRELKASTSPDAEALNARKLELDAREKELDTLRFSVQADQFVQPLVLDGKVTGPDIDALKMCYVQAALDDKFSPVTLSVGDQKVSRVEALKLSQAGRQKHILTLPDQITDTPVLGDGQKILPSQEDPKDVNGPMSSDRKKELLGMTDVGVAAIHAESK